MSALGYGIAVSQAALDIVKAAIPQPAGSSPPPVANSGAVGDVVKFALENHTHKSNVQSAQVSVTGANGLATWTFDTPFDVAPMVVAQAMTPSGAAYINVASVVAGTTTTDSVTIIVQQVVKSITLPSLALSLLGLVLSLFGYSPAGTLVNCFARRPS